MKVTVYVPGKFATGSIIITANAHGTLEPEAVAAGLMRHVAGDWGEVRESDARLNDQALKHGGRLLSVYREGEAVFWIITESDRSVTTVLLPADY